MTTPIIALSATLATKDTANTVLSSDSFENWPNGTSDAPEGWTASGAGTVTQSTSTGVTDGSFAVALGGSGKTIEKDFSFNGVEELVFDVTSTNTNFSVRVDGDLVLSEENPSGEQSIDVSNYGGVLSLSFTRSAIAPGSAVIDNLRLLGPATILPLTARDMADTLAVKGSISDAALALESELAL